MRKPDDITGEDWDAVDIPDLSDEQLANMRPAAEMMPESFMKSLKDGKIPRGRPRVKNKKVPVSLRMEPELHEALKSLGPNWQSQARAVLRELAGQDKL